jgi:MoaA/NifB/PqqE/SkfB family radical SAM enzyme/polysaccharide pyruvyl transferase WcaK-like protein
VSLIPVITDIAKAYGKRPLALEKPRVIQFPVNDICNARCQMCHIWQQKLDTQVSPEELLKALESPLFSDVRAVGINGGEPTLRKDLPDIVDALYRRLPKLGRISLITNGLVAKRVCASVDAIGEVAHRHGGELDVMVSADGVGELHDKVRGRDGNFENVLKVLDHVEASPQVDSFQVACTVVKDNVYGLHDLLDWAISRGVYIKYRLAVPHNRLYTDDVTDPFQLSAEETHHLAVFLENLIRHYEKSPPQKYFYRSLVDQLVKGEARKAGCNWQHRGVTLTARGDLAYCAVASDELGSAIHQDAESLYFGSRPHLESILRDKCADCRHDYGGLPPGPEYLRQCVEEALARTPLDLKTLARSGAGQALRGMKLRRRLRELGLDGEDPAPAGELTGGPGRKRVMICGWYGTETLGDKAILLGVLDAIRQGLGDVDISIASLEPWISRHTQAQLAELSDAQILDMDAARQALADHDLLVFAGGPVMAVNAVMDMLALFRIAAGRGVPTVAAGVGVGPLGNSRLNDCIARLLRLSSVRIFRDTHSREAAIRLGAGSTEDTVAGDPARDWFGRQQAIARSEQPTGPRLLLALRDWPAEQYSELPQSRAAEVKSEFERRLIELLRAVISQVPGATLVPFPMCTHHLGGDDRWFYRRLFRSAPDLLANVDEFHLTHETGPREACSLFAASDAALCMRFHASMLAAEMGKPLLALDYTGGSGKVAALSKALGFDAVGLEQLDVAAAGNTLSDWLRQPHTVDYPAQPSFADAFATAVAELQGGQTRA